MPTRRQTIQTLAGLGLATLAHGAGEKRNVIAEENAKPGYVRPKVYTEPKGPDARAQRITEHVLRRMLAAR